MWRIITAVWLACLTLACAPGAVAARFLLFPRSNLALGPRKVAFGRFQRGIRRGSAFVQVEGAVELTLGVVQIGLGHGDLGLRQRERRFGRTSEQLESNSDSAKGASRA